MLAVDKKYRQHVYSAAIDKEETQKGLLDSFLEKTFRGSASKLVMQLLGNTKTTTSELNEIRNYLDDLEKNTK